MRAKIVNPIVKSVYNMFETIFNERPNVENHLEKGVRKSLIAT